MFSSVRSEVLLLSNAFSLDYTRPIISRSQFSVYILTPIEVRVDWWVNLHRRTYSSPFSCFLIQSGSVGCFHSLCYLVTTEFYDSKLHQTIHRYQLTYFDYTTYFVSFLVSLPSLTDKICLPIFSGCLFSKDLSLCRFRFRHFVLVRTCLTLLDIPPVI